MDGQVEWNMEKSGRLTAGGFLLPLVWGNGRQ